VYSRNLTTPLTSLPISISIIMQAGELHSIGTYSASAILAESEVTETVVKQEEEEEKVDAFGRLIGRKVAVLESKRRSKCIDGLKDREARRRNRLQLWCEKLGLESFPEVHADNGHTESDLEGGGKGGVLINEEKKLHVDAVPALGAVVKVEIKEESSDDRGTASQADSVSDTAGKKRTMHSEEDGKDREREDELNAYYNPKKPSRAGLGMGGMGGTGGLGAPAFSSFVKAGSSTGVGTGKGGATPYLSSFLKAGSTPSSSSVAVTGLVSSSGSSAGGDRSSNSNSSSNGKSSNGVSRGDKPSSTTSHNPYRDCLTAFERAVVSSGLEAATVGDYFDLEDSDLTGEGPWTLDSMLVVLIMLIRLDPIVYAASRANSLCC
jgi:hypothetical protein